MQKLDLFLCVLREFLKVVRKCQFSLCGELFIVRDDGKPFAVNFCVAATKLQMAVSSSEHLFLLHTKL